MTISALDSRYEGRLGEILPFLGEEAFVYYMSVWSLAYAEATNREVHLPLYKDRKELYHRVSMKERSTRHQMTALLQVLQEDFPDVQFHFGLTSEDIMHNARCTQMSLIITEIYKKLRELDDSIREIDRLVLFPVLAHTHGQPATPVKLGAYLRAKIRGISLVQPDFRLGGSNGQLTALKYATKTDDFSTLIKLWLRRIKEKIPQLEEPTLRLPSSKTGLLQIGPSNENTFLSAMGLSLKLKSLSKALWDHCQRGILVPFSAANQTGSSAMPHKKNPIDFENAEGSFAIAYSTIQLALEANSDTRGLRDLSNSVINRQSSDGWSYLFAGLKSLIKGMNSSQYDLGSIMQELKQNPECLSEIYRYYLMIEEDNPDPYWEIKNNPPVDFEKTIKRMKNWNFNW